MILIFPASQHYRSFATTSSRHIYSSICPVITTNWNWCRKHLRKFMWLITVSLPPMLSRLQRIKADYWKILYFWNYREERIRLAIIYSITTLAMTVRQTFFYRRHYRSSVKLTATFTEITYRMRFKRLERIFFVPTFASWINHKCSLTYWYILSPLVRGGYKAGF